jgi:hypothetical protein
LIDFWAPVYLDKYPGGGSYSDIFSFWMEALYRIHGKEKSVDLINKNVEIDIVKNGITYHSLLYRASCDYMRNIPHMNDFEAASLMFKDNVFKLSYSNNSLRGLQYLISEKSIKCIERKNQISKSNLSFFCKENISLDVWLIALDSNYFDKYFEYIWHSYDCINNKYEIHLHLINPKDDQIAKIKNLKISYSTEFFDGLDPIPYYASARFLILSELLDIYSSSNFMITDADVLIHSKVPLSLGYDDFDMAIRMKDPELYPWRDMGAGLCLVKNNKKMRSFFDLFSKIFHEKYDKNRNPARNTQWWIDQGILYSLIVYFGDIHFKKINSELEKKFIYFPSGEKIDALNRVKKNSTKA